MNISLILSALLNFNIVCWLTNLVVNSCRTSIKLSSKKIGFAYIGFENLIILKKKKKNQCLCIVLLGLYIYYEYIQCCIY